MSDCNNGTAISDLKSSELVPYVACACTATTWCISVKRNTELNVEQKRSGLFIGFPAEVQQSFGFNPQGSENNNHKINKQVRNESNISGDMI